MAELIDLHIHSTFSDGKLRPQEIIDYMKQKSVKKISITDHNTIKAYFFDYETDGIELIPGVEIDVNYGYDVQLLCYGFDINNKTINECLDYVLSQRKRNAINLAKKLIKMGIMIDSNSGFYNDINDYENICRFMVSKGLGENIEEIKNRYFVPGAELYYDIPTIDTMECINMIKSAGGKVILAHPGRISVGKVKLKAIVDELIGMVLDGIECYHPDNSEDITNEMIMIAKENDLYITGGSDMHGSHTDFCINEHDTVLF